MDRIHIAYLFNNDMFAEMACVSMCSLLENHRAEVEIVFHLFAANVTKECIDKITEVRSRYGKVDLQFHEYFVDESFGKYVEVSEGMPSWPKDIFVKALLPDLLPDIDRLLFLDCDTVIEEDISLLWQIDLGDALVGMTTNGWTDYRENTDAKKRVLGVKQNCYFSVGVMLMNLEGLRKLCLSSIVADNVKHLHEKVMGAGLLWLPEMDCLNYALDGKIKRLPIKYNCNFWLSLVFEDSFSDCLESLSNPVIIHFLDKPKPTELGTAPVLNPEWERYHKYKAISPFATVGDAAMVAVYKRRENRSLDALKPYVDANIARWYCTHLSKQMFEMALSKYESAANGKSIAIWGLNEKTWTLVLFLAAHGLKVRSIVDGVVVNQEAAVFDYAVEPPEVLRDGSCDTFVMIDMRDYNIARHVMENLQSWGFSKEDYYHVYSPIWEGAETAEEKSSNSVLALYGAGKNVITELIDGKLWGLNPVCFCDADESKQGTMYIGLPVLSFDQVLCEFGKETSFYITLDIPLKFDVQEYLINQGVEKERIINYESDIKPYKENLVDGFKETAVREDDGLAVTDMCIENGGGAKFFSSCGEDALLLRLFMNSYRKSTIRDGFYIDVGAHHPSYASNTHVLYKLGWTGINIEANPYALSSFKRERPKDINLNYAVTKEKEEISFYLFGQEGSEWYGSSSTTDAEFKESIEKEQNLVSKEIMVQGRRLDDILSMHLHGQHIDFMNIDVENKELDVLESNDWSKYRPLVLAVEILPKPNGAFEMRHTLNSSPVVSFLEERDYICFSQTLFTWFFYDMCSERKDIVENWTRWYSSEKSDAVDAQ